MHPRETIEAFDRFLVARAARSDLIVIGGAALALLGIILRPTRNHVDAGAQDLLQRCRHGL